MHRYIQGFLPISFKDVWLTNEARRNQENINIILRNSENLNIPFARLSSSIRQPFVLLPKLWSGFENEEIKIVRNKLEFNFKLKKSMLDALPSIVNCQRLFCPACTNIHKFFFFFFFFSTPSGRWCSVRSVWLYSTSQQCL
jgi:hypothetical protein